jgi:predicted DNA-binding transcriptional regulator AlpA
MSNDPSLDQTILNSSSSNLLEGYLTREQLAAALGKSIRTIDRWQTLRAGPPRLVLGKLILFRVESVQSWLKSLEQQPRHKSRESAGRASDAKQRKTSRRAG